MIIQRTNYDFQYGLYNEIGTLYLVFQAKTYKPQNFTPNTLVPPPPPPHMIYIEWSLTHTNLPFIFP